MKAIGGALVLAALVSGCGSPSDLDPRGPAASEPGRRGGEPAAPWLAPQGPPEAAPVAAPPPARPSRIGARADPSIERCIEENVHAPDYDRMNARDSRRKLRRLQVMAECEQRLASR